MEIIPNWHPIFVHFTVALLSMAILLTAVSVFVKVGSVKNQLEMVARWNLWIGAAITMITALTGLYAYNTVAHDTPSHIAMTEHRNWAVITAGFFILLAAWSIWQYRKSNSISIAFVISLLVGFVLLGSTAWRGGEVVYRYGLGVMSLPQISESTVDGHDHSHGETEEITDRGHDVIEKTEMSNKDQKLNTVKKKAGDGHDHVH